MFADLSKMVLCGLMLRGRLRAVPYNIDPAVSIPGDELLIEATPEEPSDAAQSATERTAEELAVTEARVSPKPKLSVRQIRSEHWLLWIEGIGAGQAGRKWRAWDRLEDTQGFGL
ncbi:hypothetical protein PRZ48_003817 [Zasmidium cellare]|uniref:Uncharacterized protein n=1 Tax=Zasmidium cellare TaxID=395010 RepID=A0ABR0EWH6_ZASCE|nr:hypothetical protein PRZ48_003817 [Zasmidium cellare]